MMNATRQRQDPFFEALGSVEPMSLGCYFDVSRDWRAHGEPAPSRWLVEARFALLRNSRPHFQASLGPFTLTVGWVYRGIPPDGVNT